MLFAPLSLNSASVFEINGTARLSISGLITGGREATLTKTGAGTLSLEQGYTYAGSTVVREGRLELGLSAAVDQTGSRTITLEPDARLVFIGLTNDLILPETVIVGRDGASVDELVASANSQFNVEWKGGSTVKRIDIGSTLDLSTLNSGAKLEVLGDGTFLFATSKAKELENKVLVGNTLTLSVGGSSVLTLNGTISDGSLAGISVVGRLLKQNEGTTVLAGNNSYSGGTEVRGGTLELRSSHAAGTGDVVVGAAAVLALHSEDGTVLALPNRITGTGSLRKLGSGTFVLNGTSEAFSGPTFITAGTLEVGQNLALGTGRVSVKSAAALRFNPAASTTVALENSLTGEGRLLKDGEGTFLVDDAVMRNLPLRMVLNGGTLAFSGCVEVTAPLTVAGDVRLETRDGVGTLSGVLSGGGTLNLTGVLSGGANVASGESVTINGGTLTTFEKKGAGKMTLGAGAVLGGGSLRVAAGTLKVNSQKTLSRVSTLEVGTGKAGGSVLDVSQLANGLVVGGGSVPQVLKGSGTIKGLVKLDRGATLAPGNSPGTQTIEGGLVVGPGAFYQVEYSMSGALVRELDSIRVAKSDSAGAGGSPALKGDVELQGGVVIPAVYRDEKAAGGQILTSFGKARLMQI